MATTIGMERYEMATEDYEGFCATCGDFTATECEPDARDRTCPDCGEATVCGAEEALLMGLIAIDDEE